MKKIVLVIAVLTATLGMVSCKPGNSNEPEKPIVRTVKPTASFKMTVTGINPDKYVDYMGVKYIMNSYDASCKTVSGNGHSWGTLMQTKPKDGVWENYDKPALMEYVHDNSYVGGRITCLVNSTYTTENPTTEQIESMRTSIENAFYEFVEKDFWTLEGDYELIEPDGPFQIKITGTWKFRLGRDSTYTYIDEEVKTYKNHKELVDALLSCNENNPLAQTLFYYDAKKDEFILQDRKKNELK